MRQDNKAVFKQLSSELTELLSRRKESCTDGSKIRCTIYVSIDQANVLGKDTAHLEKSNIFELKLPKDSARLN